MRRFHKFISEAPSSQSIEDHFDDYTDSQFFIDSVKPSFIIMIILLFVGILIGYFVR